MELTRLGYRPKHIVIADDVREKILSNQLEAGQFLKPELELSKHYGVSNKTVSLALSVLVTERLIERIPRRGTMVISEEERNSRKSVCLVMLENVDVYGKITTGITSRLLPKDLYPVTINNSVYNGDSSGVIRFLENFMNDNPYGAIVDGHVDLPFDFFRRNLKKIHKLVFVNHFAYPKKIPGAKYALIDYEDAGRKVARYLIDKGHRSLAFWGSRNEKVEDSLSTQSRLLKGFGEICKKFGVSFNHDIAIQHMKGKPLTDILSDLKENQQLPDAVFGNSHSHINSVVRPELEKLGLQPPNDVSLMSFYDPPNDRNDLSPLTSVSICEDKLAAAAIKLILNETNESEIFIKPIIIERDSVKDRN